MREKVGKSRNTVFFQWFVAPEGRKVGSLKRRVRSQLARWEMKNCTPLWREAHFQVKMYKTPQLRTTFGSWDVEKVHAVAAQSTFRSQNVQNTPGFGPLLEVEMSKKCTPLWREAHFEVKMLKALAVRTAFGRSDVVLRGRRGTFEEDLHRCIFRGRHSTKDMFMRDVRRSGRWFPGGVAFWSIRSVGLLRWFCVTGATLRMTWHQFFVAGAVL